MQRQSRKTLAVGFILGSLCCCALWFGNVVLSAFAETETSGQSESSAGRFQIVESEYLEVVGGMGKEGRPNRTDQNGLPIYTRTTFKIDTFTGETWRFVDFTIFDEKKRQIRRSLGFVPVSEGDSVHSVLPFDGSKKG